MRRTGAGSGDMEEAFFRGMMRKVYHFSLAYVSTDSA
jgi:hypothetical protein